MQPQLKRRIETKKAVHKDAPESAASNMATRRNVRIHYGGHDFIASPEMVGIFLHRAQRVTGDCGAQLVSLLHRDGIELLYVDAKVPMDEHGRADNVDQHIVAHLPHG